MSDSATIEREKHMKQLKRRMECWREVILPLNSILLWERSWYPGLILGITTTIFFISYIIYFLLSFFKTWMVEDGEQTFLIWMLEPTVLTIISVSLLILALVDYIVLPIASFLCPVYFWTGQKEKKFNEICQNLSTFILQLQSFWRSMLQTRNDRPNVYYAAIISCLVLCIWIGSTINNLLLFYVTVNLLLLMPGLRHKARVSSTLSLVRNYLSHDKQS